MTNRIATSLTILTITLLHGADLSTFEKFTTLRTIAGTGTLEDGNFWQSSFEGADPRSVELSNPHDCGTDAFGRVYIVDKESHSILRVSADGTTLNTIAGTHTGGNGPDSPADAITIPLSNPNGLHVFLDGSFLILDTDNHKVRQVDANGRCSTLFTYPQGFGAGRGLVASPDQSAVYFCGENTGIDMQFVKKWTPGGISTVAIIPAGTRGLGNLALAPDGSLLVTSVGDHRVYRVPEGGLPEVIAGNGLETGNQVSGSMATEVSLNRVRGVAVLPDGTFFLATQKGGDIWWVDNGPIDDGANRRIYLFLQGAENGNVISGDGLSRIGTVDRISEPRSVHIATNGDLLITTNDSGVIRAIRNICKPTAPALRLINGELHWQPNDNEVSWLETSTSLAGESWSPIKISEPEGTSEMTFPIGPLKSRGFFRLQAPQLAGGF